MLSAAHSQNEYKRLQQRYELEEELQRYQDACQPTECTVIRADCADCAEGSRQSRLVGRESEACMGAAAARMRPFPGRWRVSIQWASTLC